MADKFVVTPWEVSGEIDYDRLTKEFGTQKLDDQLLQRLEKLTGPLHHLLRRHIFFSHRDLDRFLGEYEKGNKGFLYTGRGPSGHTHLGHLVPWMLTRWLQQRLGLTLYFQMTDDEKFLFKDDLELKQATAYALENALDVIALGFEPQELRIIIDTKLAGVLYPEAIKVAKRITFSTTKAVFGFNNSNNVGEIFYTSMQAVPAFLPSVAAGKKLPCLIPLAIDQDPHFRVTRDVIGKLGYPKPAIIHCRFLPGLQEGKMSTSGSNAAQNVIFTTDDAKTVKNKITKYAFSGGKDTVEAHRRHGGDPDVDAAYQYLTFFEEDDRKLKRYYDDYKSGKLLSGELKAILIEKLNGFLAEHQKRREAARKRLHEYLATPEEFAPKQKH
jgi:tryptophanyl-tRNA synthetase